MKVDILPSEVKDRKFKCSYLDEISLSGLFLRSKTSVFQKSAASNYVTLKRIFSYTVVQPKVTNAEYNFLAQNEFLPLEMTSEKRMYEELMKIVDMNDSKNELKISLADKIFQIRIKELKYIFANVPAPSLNEMEGGYKILDKYLEFIAG